MGSAAKTGVPTCSKFSPMLSPYVRRTNAARAACLSPYESASGQRRYRQIPLSLRSVRPTTTPSGRARILRLQIRGLHSAQAKSSDRQSGMPDRISVGVHASSFCPWGSVEAGIAHDHFAFGLPKLTTASIPTLQGHMRIGNKRRRFVYDIQ